MTTKTEKIPLHRLDGVCHVLHLSDSQKIQEWTKHDDHYYLDSKGDAEKLQVISKAKFTYCTVCHAKDKEAIRQVARLSLRNSKLIGMELFCGMLPCESSLHNSQTYIFQCRRWGARSWDGPFWICRNKTCSGIFAIRSQNLHVSSNFHLLSLVSNVFHISLGKITPTL